MHKVNALRGISVVLLEHLYAGHYASVQIYELLHAELDRAKQLLMNNGYTNSDVDREIRILLDNHLNRQTKPKNRSVCNLFLPQLHELCVQDR